MPVHTESHSVELPARRPHRIGSRYVEGDFASLDGGWALAASRLDPG